MPVSPVTSCVCDRWISETCHWSEVPESVPSSTSVAKPRSSIVSPIVYSDPSTGDWIVAVGGLLPTETCAIALALAPLSSVTVRRASYSPALL